MNLKHHLRTAALVLISGASMVIAFYVVGIETVLSALRGVERDAIVLAGILVLANAGIAFLRFRSVLRAFGYRPGWRQIVFAFTIGQVSNQLLFNIIGQSLSRAAALNSAGVPFSVSVMATYWERLVAAGLLFLLSIAGAFFVFIDIRIDLQAGGAYLLSLTGTAVLVAFVIGAILLRSREAAINLSGAARFLLRLWPSIILTLAAHGMMLAAYIAVLSGLQVPKVDLSAAAALVIVMFAAALPISFSGWGIRELSAAQALGAVGIDPTVAVAGAVLIGLLGLLTTLIAGAIGLYLYFHPQEPAASPQLQLAPAMDSDRWSQIAVLGAAVITAMLLYFQIRVPLEHGEVTVNAADVLALTGLGLLAFVLWTKRSLAPVPAWFFGGLAAISLLLLLALGLGYIRFGSNSWALMNRGLGWIIILGYVTLGISAAFAAAGSVRMVLGVFAMAGVTVAAQQLALLLLALFGTDFPADAFVVPLRGYANNSNAFAFQLVMSAACVVTASRIGLFGIRPSLYNAALVIIGLAIYYTNSRAGLGMLTILLVLMVTFAEPQRRGQAFRSAMIVALALLVAAVMPTVLATMRVMLLQLLSEYLRPADLAIFDRSITPYLSITVQRTSSDSERWLSIIEGWELWLKHPLLGAGLGGYVQERIEAGRKFLVIHSVPVWLMAETGLVGLLVTGTVLAMLVNHAFQLMARPDRHGWGIGLLLILACMSAAGLVHDLFFQRSFWFLLGLYVAAGFLPEERQNGSPRPG